MCKPCGRLSLASFTTTVGTYPTWKITSATKHRPWRSPRHAWPSQLRRDQRAGPHFGRTSESCRRKLRYTKTINSLENESWSIASASRTFGNVRTHFIHQMTSLPSLHLLLHYRQEALQYDRVQGESYGSPELRRALSRWENEGGALQSNFRLTTSDGFSAPQR